MEIDGERAGRAARGEFRVGAFLVRPQLKRVVAPTGRVVQVQPKIMDVLVVLAERAGEVVTREELFASVWAGTHVTEHVLARAISALRKIFGDRPQRARFIETIPKTGYRLIASVTRDDDDEETRERADARRTEAEAEAQSRRPAATNATPEAAPAHAFASRLGLTRTNFWLGMAALSCAAALVVLVLVVFLVTRDAGHLHLHPHH